MRSDGRTTGSRQRRKEKHATWDNIAQNKSKDKRKLKKKPKNPCPPSKDVSQCYGVACDCCVQQCQFKEAGQSVLADERHSKNVQSGATKIIAYQEWDGEEDAPVEFLSFADAMPEAAAGNGAAILRFFYWSLKRAPRATMAILERAFEGKNQSDTARKRGVTRQAISKLYKGDLVTLAKLLGIRRPNIPESHIWRLSPLEFQVMQLFRSFPNITEREIATRLNRPQPTIHRAKASAILKMNQNPPSKPNKKRINKKTA